MASREKISSAECPFQDLSTLGIEYYKVYSIFFFFFFYVTHTFFYVILLLERSVYSVLVKIYHRLHYRGWGWGGGEGRSCEFAWEVFPCQKIG